MTEKPENVNPKVRIGEVKIEGAKKVDKVTDLFFTKPAPELIERSGLTEDEVKKYRTMAMHTAQARLGAAKDMGKLVDEERQPTDVQLAKARVLNRRRTMTPKELGIWEALRDPFTGIPPQDVRISDGGNLIINN